MYSEFFGKRLKEARQAKGLTLIQAEIATGIDSTKICRIENNKRQPTIEDIGILAQTYEVSLDWLFGNVKKEQ